MKHYIDKRTAQKVGEATIVLLGIAVLYFSGVTIHKAWQVKPCVFDICTNFVKTLDRSYDPMSSEQKVDSYNTCVRIHLKEALDIK